MIRGLAAITVGVITVVWHQMTIGFLVLVFFGYALIDGLVALAGAVRAAEARESWGSLWIEALAGMAIAMLAITSACVITEVTLIYIIAAAWALITGVFEIFSAVRLRKHIRGEWLLVLSGFASLTLGTSIVALPIAGASAIAIWIGLYAFVLGELPVELGLRLRRGLPHHHTLV